MYTAVDLGCDWYECWKVTDANDDKSKNPKRAKRRFGRWLFGFFVFLGAFLWWLNGPGLRMLAPRLGAHFADKAGVEVVFELRGTLWGGVTLHDVEVMIPGSGLRKITIREIVPDYQLSRLLRGEVRGVRGSGLHLDLVMMPGDEAQKEPSQPLDFAMLNQTLRKAQTAVARYSFDVSELTATIEREGMGAIEIGPTAIQHEAGGGEILVELGDITRGGESIMVAQRIQIEWTPERLGVDRVVFDPQLSVEGLAVLYPEEGALFAEGVVNFAGAVFAITSTPGQGTLGLQMREGVLDAARVGEFLGIELPVVGRLTSLALDAADLSPDPRNATATVSMLIESVQWKDLAVDEFGVDVILDAGTARVVARAAAGGAEVRVDSTTTLDRAAMTLGETRGVLEIPSLVAMAEEFEEFWKPPDDAEPIPAASLKADFEVTWKDDFLPASAAVALAVTPEEPEVATALQIKASWAVDELIAAELLVDGADAMAKIDFDEKKYSGEVSFQGFETDRIAVWLELAGIALPGEGRVDAEWNGNGPLAADGHVGELAVASALWSQPEQPDVIAGGKISYALPGNITLRELNVVRDGQSVDASLSMLDGWLKIDFLRWTDAEGTQLAETRGSVPVPEKLADWSAFPAEDDTRPLDFTIRTETLGFDKLATWVPALAAVDARATAQLEVMLSGNFTAPVLDASLEVRQVRIVDQPALPPADFMFKAAGRDGALALNGTITTADYDPVVVMAALPFSPAQWAADPESLSRAEFEASAVLPRLDLGRFSALVPKLRRMAGVVTGSVRASGTIGEPNVEGRLELSGGVLGFPDEVFPDITGIAAVAELGTELVTLSSLRATIAGGTLEAGGSYAIKPRELDLRVRGNSLPLVRNESLIVRANADLRATGPIDRAKISGSVSLVDSLFFRDIEILPIGTPFRVPDAAALPKIDVAPPTDAVPELFAAWPLDVRLTTAEPLLIRGNLATGRILMDLRVGGTLRDPRPAGQARLLRGRAVLPFATLAVPEAVLTFTPANGLDPSIELRGTAEPRPYTVNVFAYGRLSDPQIVLSSNPPLPQHEIMTLLATGTTTRGLEDPQAASARALQLFAEEVRRGRVPLGNQLRPLLGLLDRVDFTLAESDPYSSDTFSTATLKLHDRWYLSAGMGEEGNTRMFAIWRLRFR